MVLPLVIKLYDDNNTLISRVVPPILIRAMWYILVFLSGRVKAEQYVQSKLIIKECDVEVDARFFAYGE